MQQIIRKVTFATLQTTNMLVENPSSATDNSKAITQSVDSIAMLGHLKTQLSQFRREQIKPALKSDYSAMCSAKVPLSSQYLFGDDLAKKLRDARESSKIIYATTKAGQVAANFAAWRELTTDRVILSDVLGVSIECTTTPIQHRLPAQTFSEHEYVLVCEEIHKLL